MDAEWIVEYDGRPRGWIREHHGQVTIPGESEEVVRRRAEADLGKDYIITKIYRDTKSSTTA
ncbi:hypothetical protein KW785_00195 [Candidatus Parcubacteria bacterium]|nr:hypothetical protein [Candidatus Parcubacteria bacterium]